MIFLRILTVCSVFSWIVLMHGQRDQHQSKEEFIREREDIVKGLALHATELHSRRAELVQKCKCSKHSCSNDFLDVPCECHFGNQSICKTEGWRIDYNDTIIRVAPGTDPEKLSDATKENICVYKHIFDYLKKYTDRKFAWTYLGITFSRNEWNFVMYAGTPDGHLRRYPASARERDEEDGEPLLNNCKKYDSRIRPWFIAASTGPKDIVLVVDKSQLMNETVGSANKTKWELTVAAVDRILETFTFTDFINVVTFSDDAAPLKESGLLRGNFENLQNLRDEIREVHPKGKANFSAAFTVAFDQLTNYCERNETCSDCFKTILFLSDGRDTSGKKGTSVKPSEMAKTIDNLQEKLIKKTGKQASIFTYSMSGKDDAIPRQVACANDGAWAFIGPDTDPLDALNSYYLYIAAGRKKASPIWVVPYKGTSGLGRKTSVAMPFFAKGRELVSDVFLGVVGQNVLFQEFERAGFKEEEVLETVISRSQNCTPPNPSPCEFQVYRNSRDPRAVCPDRFPVETLSHPDSNNTDIKCYYYIGRFYKRFPKTVQWKDAKDSCKKDGGVLVSIEDEMELAFVANLVSVDGSWVGACKDDNKYSWLDKEAGYIERHSSYWGVGEPINEACVAMDNRGIIGNLKSQPCSQNLSYVCRYDSRQNCRQDIAEVPNRGYFEIPPLNVCNEVVKALGETKPIPNVSKLSSTDVMCPLGEPSRTNEEVFCCTERCKKNK